MLKIVGVCDVMWIAGYISDFSPHTFKVSSF